MVFDEFVFLFSNHSSSSTSTALSTDTFALSPLTSLLPLSSITGHSLITSHSNEPTLELSHHVNSPNQLAHDQSPSTETDPVSTEYIPVTDHIPVANSHHTQDAEPQPSHQMVTRAKAGIVKPNPNYYVDLTFQDKEPTSVQEALASPEWKEAMQREYDALCKNKTWVLIPPNSTYNVVGAKWVFKLKRTADGSISRYKVRLFAKGFHQNPGIDFTETFSPVVKPQTIRVVLAIVVSNGWPMRQLDVNNVFLNGDLQETVYMTQPEGFRSSQHPTHVCKLVKALYGLKQAPRAWFDKLKHTLIHWGFMESKSDASLFIYAAQSSFLALLVYVADILITGSNTQLINKVITDLNAYFALKNLGDLHYFLGIEAYRDHSGLFLTQSKYISDLLSKNHMLHCKSCSTPASTCVKFSKSIGTPLTNLVVYRSTVGSLQYLSMTLLDIAFIVSKLSQFLQSPTDIQWQAYKRVLRYLKGTIDKVIHLSPTKEQQLIGFSD